jgi:superfamily I DNA/RNA helicase|tara:strand:- start:1524 stop:3014 length:1491 start_codon:yes stop_codon:yes gene_type:complete
MINIILGPPGTGKTTELLNICRQKKEQGVAWNKIGFFSFSRKAAYEARDRARDKFQASRDDLVHFRTLHSFAYKHLPLNEENLMKTKHWKELSNMIGFNLVFNENDDSVYTNSNHKYINLINTARLKDVTLEEECRNSNEILNMVKLDYFNRVIKEYKKENKLFDFTDMIIDYTNDTFLTQFDVLFIDEAQDMPRIQYNMVDKLILNSKETYIAGDDDQAIFRWSGADVDKFIGLEGNVTVLNKSYRCPQRVFRLANYIISKIRNRRSKTWKPKEAQGKVRRMADIRHIDFSQGNWLILGRTKKIRNEMIEDFLLQEGYWYGRGEHRPISTTILDAIEIWQRLQHGIAATLPEVKTLYSKIRSKEGIKHGSKKFKKEDEDKSFTLTDLKNNHGLLVDGEWWEVLSALTPFDVTYLRRLEKIGEDIKGEPRIRVSTIHQAKGGECDNVVVLLDLGRLVYKAYVKNPEDEHRVFYVAVTRAKENLYLVEAQRQEGYLI